MGRSRKINLEKVRASLDKIYPRCGFAITPDLVNPPRTLFPASLTGFLVAGLPPSLTDTLVSVLRCCAQGAKAAIASAAEE
jgi:hypothetical protein